MRDGVPRMLRCMECYPADPGSISVGKRWSRLCGAAYWTMLRVQCCMRAEALTSLPPEVIFSTSKKHHQGESPMPVAIRQLHKHFVGEVSGVDLRKPLTKD